MKINQVYVFNVDLKCKTDFDSLTTSLIMHRKPALFTAGFIMRKLWNCNSL